MTALDHLQKALGFTSLILLVMIVAMYLGIGGPGDWNPLIAFAIFFSVLVNIIIFWRQRIPMVLMAVGILFIFKLLTVESFIQYAHMNVIVFLLGMMIVIAFLEDRGFFDAVLSLIMTKCYGNAKQFFIVVMVISAVSAALVDEVSSILFMCALVLKAAKKYEVNPTPFVLSVVFATNVGSTFTVLGNPVGVLIAFEGNLTFNDFLTWSLPVGLVVLGVTIPLTMKMFSKDIAKMNEKMRCEKPVKTTIYKDLLLNPQLRIPMAIFLGTIIGLMLHHALEEMLGLEKNSLLLVIPIIAAAVSLLYGHTEAALVVEKRVQWSTLVFFIFFFGVTGALKFAGVTDIFADKILSISGDNPVLLLLLFLWLAGIMSAFMDNLLAVATLAPIVTTIMEASAADPVFSTIPYPLWWAVLFGSCYMGNLTIIGSSANIVAHTYYERNHGVSISFFEWLKPGLIVSLVQMGVASALLLIMHANVFG